MENKGETAEPLRPRGPCPKCPDGLMATRTSERLGDFKRVLLRCDRCRYTPPRIYIAADTGDARRRDRGKVCVAHTLIPHTSKPRPYDRRVKGGAT